MLLARSTAALAVALAVPIGVAAGAPNLIVNGTFDAGPPVARYIELSAGSERVPGWSVVDGDVDLVGPYWQASSGNTTLELDGIPAGAIEQRVRTARGRRYRLAFALAGNPDGAPRVKTLVVRIGATTHQFTFDTAGRTKSAMGYVRKTVEFTATATTTTLRFANGDARYFWGPVIDDVEITPLETSTPAPAAPSPASAPSSVATSTPTQAARTLGGSLAGVWTADYPGVPLLVRISQQGSSVVARALQGAGSFGKGNVIWYGDASATRFVVVGHCADTSVHGWHAGVITTSGLDLFTMRTESCPAAVVTYTRSHR